MEKLQFIKNYTNDEVLRKSFTDFALESFDVHYEKWYKAGLWNEKSDYINYSYFEGEQIVSNVSVNKFCLMINGEKKNAIQLGTVMTKEKYKNKGLIRELMKRIFAEYDDECDFYYLYANDTVTNFYPKFGFKRTAMNSFRVKSEEINHQKATLKKLAVEKDWDLINRLTVGRKPISNTLGIMEDEWPLKVYCKFGFADELYYLAEEDSIVVLETQGEDLNIYDIISQENIDLDNILEKIGGDKYKWINICFTPDLKRYKPEVGIIDDDNDTLFVKNYKFPQEMKFLFPKTSET